MGKASRDKGARGERELASLLNRLFPWAHASRGQQHKGGPDSPDVAHKLFGLHFECKRTESVSIYADLEQACQDAGKDQIPVLAHRRNGHEWVFVILAEDAPAFAKALYVDTHAGPF